MTLDKNDQERQLAKKIAEGDEQAFSILFFKYLPVLQSFALKFSKSEIIAEEIIQEAFLRIWLNRDKLAEVDNLKAYLYKYVSNECLTYLKKKIKQQRITDDFKVENIQSSNITVESIRLNEITKIAREAIAQLPAQRKKIYQLSRDDGKSIPEIAELLNLSTNTVKNSLVSALKTIRVHLNNHDIFIVFPLFYFFLK